ncbi:MAG: site-2 protease family protein [Methanobacterium sp.]|uniref:site-2 protease family protein n=1 Tax=Methanobacterium sp. TaxID=2164 RepID=UPI003C713056
MALNALYYYAIGFIIIWVVALLFRDRLKIEIEGPIMMRRTKRLRDFIDAVAMKSPRSWRFILNIGIPVSFFFMILTLGLILYTLSSTFTNPQLSLILPGVDIPGSQAFIPLGYGIIGLITVLVVHEFGHGIISRVEGVKIDSIGVLLLAVLPGAFVEPNEEDVQKSERIQKLRIYAAGSIFNLMLAAISLIITTLITLMIVSSIFVGVPGFAIPGTHLETPNIGGNITGPIFPTFHNGGVQIYSVVPGSPANGKIPQGTVIQSINGVDTTTLAQAEGVFSQLKVGENVTLQTTTGNYTIKTIKNPDNSTGYIGIRAMQQVYVNNNVAKTVGAQIPWFIYSIGVLFFWIFLLNFSVGIFNLLPLKPLDGGLLLEELLRYKLSESVVRKIMTPLSYFLILLIASIIIYSLGRGILLSLA